MTYDRKRCQHTRIRGVEDKFCEDAGCYMCSVCGKEHQGSRMIGRVRYCEDCAKKLDIAF